MRVRLYKTDKRYKSTERIELSEGLNPPIRVYEDVYLKEKTDLDFMTLVLDGTLYDANYVYVDDWESFYFIRKWRKGNREIYEIDCEIDLLATFKTWILTQRCFVLYSTSHFNRFIRDDRVPILPQSEISFSDVGVEVNGTGLFVSSGNEAIILTTVSKEQGIVHWVTTEIGLADIIESLVSASDSVWESLQLQFGDAMGSIVQAMRLPVNPQALPLSSETYQVYLGNYPLEMGTQEPIQMYKLVNTHVGVHGSINIPEGYDDFRVAEPYSALKMSLPFIGIVDLNYSDFNDEGDGNIYYKMDLDLSTGNIIWTIKATDSDNRPIATYAGQCGAMVPVASSQRSAASAIVGGLVASAATFAAGHYTGTVPMMVAAAASGLSGALGGFYTANQKSSSIIGSYSGGHSEYANRRVRLIWIKFKTANEPSNLAPVEGRPLCRVVSLQEITGYVRTVGASLKIPTTADRVKRIEQLLDSGIYIE